MDSIRFLIFFFVGSIISFGQNSGQVIYEVSLNHKSVKNKELSKTVRDMISNSQDVEFILSFSKTESLYQKQKAMRNDASESNLNIVEVFAGGEREIYFDAKQGYQIDKISMGEENFLVRKDPLSWKITSETKLIGNYNCLKAILLDDKKNETKTVAWFTPDLPVRFGPNYYNNLPGLVLSVQDNMLIYSARTIKISKENRIIVKPTGGKPITYEEFKDKFSGLFIED